MQADFSPAGDGTAALPRSAVDARAAFINRTYLHLFGAIGAFTLIEVWLFRSGVSDRIAQAMFSVNWLLILGAFMLVGWFASRVAHTIDSPGAQYGALGLFVLAEALLFVPLLYLADTRAPGVVQSAAGITIAGFTGLTAVAFVTRKDFSFLRGILMWGGIIALIAIVAAVLFGFTLGPMFSVAMVAFAGASVLYDTSKIIRSYPTDKHVGAALGLFASIALMFWYVLRLVMGRR